MRSASVKRPQFFIQFAYLGSCFYGLQPQTHLPTAGSALRDLLTLAAGVRPSALQFAARTDKGVHALHNLATCWFKPPFDEEQFLKRFRKLPKPFGLLAAYATSCPSFVHARAVCYEKHYRYVIETGCDENTEVNPFAWQIALGLNTAAMQEAASHLVGTFDFQSFRTPRCTFPTSSREISSLDISCLSLGNGQRQQIHIDIRGKSFLRQMIRILAGTLAEIGSGMRSPDCIKDILAAKDRRYAGIAAPAHGLTLMHTAFHWTSE